MQTTGNTGAFIKKDVHPRPKAGETNEMERTKTKP